MEETTKRVRSDLIIVFGFSRENADIAIQMFFDGALNKPEEEVISRLLHAPWIERPQRLEYKESKQDVAEHLNYRITRDCGGRAVSPSRLKRTRT